MALRFDLIVIGSGPAGAAAATCAAGNGLRVALIDRHRFPRNKLCGGGVTGRGAAAAGSILGRELPDGLLEPRRSFEFHAHGRMLARLDDAPAMFMTTRMGLDAHLHATALDAGAQDFSGRKIAALDPLGPGLRLATGETLSAPLMIGADGVNSATARALFGRAFEDGTVGLALEIEAPPPATTDMAVRIDFAAADWGYGWRFPKSGSTTVGVGGLHRRNPDMKRQMRCYIETPGLDPAGQRVQGHFMPFGAFRRTPGKGPVLLAGDAAGLVDPITGEGIAYALQSGALAARAAVEALARGRPETALPRYRESLAPIHLSLVQARAIRLAIFTPALREGFLRAFRRSDRLRHDYMRMLAGELEYGDIARGLLWRLPKLAAHSLAGGLGLARG